jgi:hypothetical protein
MPLAELNLPIREAAVPREVRSFLREANRRIEQFQLHGRIPGFVPSDFERAYVVLRALAADFARGYLFCEWGSGFGVVACLAALLDFEACGIEIEGELVDAAQQLAADYDLPVQFIQGSFIPPAGEAYVHARGEFAWLTTEGGDTQEELGLALDDFDVIFAYPWPDEERLIEDLFEQYARVGAVLVTYHGGEDFRLARKRGRGKR